MYSKEKIKVIKKILDEYDLSYVEKNNQHFLLADHISDALLVAEKLDKPNILKRIYSYLCSKF